MPDYNDPRNWVEDFSDQDNGDYICRCCICKELFRGYKRRVVCRVCDKPVPKIKVIKKKDREAEAIKLVENISKVEWKTNEELKENFVNIRNKARRIIRYD